MLFILKLTHISFMQDFVVTFQWNFDLGACCFVIRTRTFTMVTAVRYELVALSQVQDKITELSHLIQKVWIDDSCASFFDSRYKNWCKS